MSAKILAKAKLYCSKIFFSEKTLKFLDSFKHIEQGIRDSLEDFKSLFLDFLNGTDQN